MKIKILIVIATMLLGSKSVFAGCMPTQNINISVERFINQLNVSNDLGIREITVKQGNSLSSTHYGLGLYNGSFQIKSSFFTKYQTLPNNKLCVAVTDVKINIILNPTIYIANNFINEACSYNVIKEHEYKHFQYEINAIEDTRNYALSIAQNYLPRDSYVFNSKQEADYLIKNAIDKMQANIGANFETKATNQHKMLDTKEEYDRNGVVCNGFIHKTIRELKYGGKL